MNNKEDELERIILFARQKGVNTDEARGFYLTSRQRNRRLAYERTVGYIHMRATEYKLSGG